MYQTIYLSPYPFWHWSPPANQEINTNVIPRPTVGITPFLSLIQYLISRLWRSLSQLRLFWGFSTTQILHWHTLLMIIHLGSHFTGHFARHFLTAHWPQRWGWDVTIDCDWDRLQRPGRSQFSIGGCCSLRSWQPRRLGRVLNKGIIWRLRSFFLNWWLGC